MPSDNLITSTVIALICLRAVPGHAEADRSAFERTADFNAGRRMPCASSSRTTLISALSRRDYADVCARMAVAVG
jgi:hypothetical protein